jgi:hypothetical protein
MKDLKILISIFMFLPALTSPACGKSLEKAGVYRGG